MEKGTEVSFKTWSNLIQLYGLSDSVSLFSYKDDFEAIWGLLDASPMQFNNLPTTFIIIWDDIPASGTQTDDGIRKYLTPIDWAVGFSLSVLSSVKKGIIQCPDLKILIFDLTSDLYSGADSLKLLEQFPKQSMKSLPWVRFFKPGNKDLCWNMGDLFDCITIGTKFPLSSMSDTVKNETPDLDILKNIWAAILTRPSTPGNHHALANIIGPVLLMEDERYDVHLTALRHLMRALDLIPEKKGENTLTKGKPWIKWDELILGDILSEPSTLLELVLIDDQYELGWGKMLCLASGIDFDESIKPSNELQLISNDVGKVIVKASKSPEWIMSMLKGYHEKNEIDKRFSLVLDPDNKRQHPEILFLDLRLFSGKDISAEVDFFAKLIPIAKALNDKGNLPWPGFARDDEEKKIKGEIEIVEAWLKNPKREDEGYIIALTFLPRILSLTDLSLPIIIFSSTGRWDIAEKLKPYGNIITDFDKPKFTVDIPQDIAGQTKMKFFEALGKAFQILRARNKCNNILRAYKYREKPLISLGNNRGLHVELFIDEYFEDGRARLKVLPNNIQFPKDIQDKIEYKPKDKMLLYKWRMTEQEKNQLLNLSTDQLYQDAINKLFFSSQKYKVRVGGLFALYTADNIESARRKADAFDADLVQSGIRYFDALGVGVASKTSRIKRKKNSSASELKSIYKSSHNIPDHLVFLKLEYLLPHSFVTDDPFDSHSGDNLFRNAMISLVELFFSECLPPLFDKCSEGVSISIFAGTRVNPYKHQLDKFHEAKYRLGLDSFYSGKNNTHYLKSINRDSLFPIVSDIVSFHGLKGYKIYRVLGVKLPYEGESTYIPEYFVCRKCKKIISIDPHRDIKIICDITGTILPPRLATVVGSSMDSQGNKNTYIRAIDTGGNQLLGDTVVFSNGWLNVVDINQVQLGDVVIYGSIRTVSSGKHRASGVRLLTAMETTQFEGTQKKNILDVKLECDCISADFLPDYRALHYVADEVLNHYLEIHNNKGYGEIIKLEPYGFDDELNSDLMSCITASRFLDSNDIVSAIVKVNAGIAHSLSDYCKVKPLLLSRIASKMNNIGGDDFCKIGKLLNITP